MQHLHHHGRRTCFGSGQPPIRSPMAHIMHHMHHSGRRMCFGSRSPPVRSPMAPIMNHLHHNGQIMCFGSGWLPVRSPMVLTMRHMRQHTCTHRFICGMPPYQSSVMAPLCHVIPRAWVFAQKQNLTYYVFGVAYDVKLQHIIHMITVSLPHLVDHVCVSAVGLEPTRSCLQWILSPPP